MTSLDKPLLYVAYQLQNIKNAGIKYASTMYHNIFKFIVTLKIWNSTKWVDIVESKRDEYLIKEYSSRLDNIIPPNVISSIFANQLDWHNNNKNNTLSKQTGLLLCFKVLNKLTPLFNIISVQSITNDFSKVFRLLVTKEIQSQSKLCISIDRYAVTPSINTDVGASLIVPVTERLSDLTADLISSQVINKILLDLWNLGTSNNITNIKFNNNDTIQPFVFYADKCNKVAVHINQISAIIAANTRRGAGNFIITNPVGITTLQISNAFTSNSSAIQYNENLTLMGTLNNKINVYCTNTIFPTNEKIPFLIGYQGKTSLDTGYVYAIQQLIYPMYDNIISIIDDYLTFEANETIVVDSKKYYQVLLVDASNE